MASPATIRAFEATPLEAIPQSCSRVRAAFQSNKTKDVEWRRVQLRKLYWAISDMTAQIQAALMQDLRKSSYESQLAEIDWCKNDCLFLLENLDKLVADEYLGAPHVPPTFMAAKVRVHKEPLGPALIISPYNFPFLLLISPLVGAIAAGCPAVLKPSESAPAVAMVIREMIETRLDTNAFAVVNGAVPETNALMDEKWGKIFYTGGTMVGTIIAKKAAETLTPVTLELGGRNPAFITKNANLRLAARRLLWGKSHNGGQVCLSHNYVLVEKPAVDELVRQLNIAFKEFFPNGARGSEIVHVINDRHFERMKKQVDSSKGKIVMGGQMDKADLFIEPTAVLVDSMDDSMIQEETFGPTFSILPVNSLTEAIAIANQVDPTPLALYSFGSKAENNRILNEVTSGGATFNDSFLHASIGGVSFGGVGTSGTGAYRGFASFETFTHRRSVAETPNWLEPFIRVRYMPYDWSALRRLRFLQGKKARFDRNGKTIRGLGYWAGLVLSLGGGGLKGILARWAIVVYIGYSCIYGFKVPKITWT